MPESQPKFLGGPVTCHANAAITGARFVTIAAAPTGGNPTVGPPAAGARVYGVAGRDAASGAKVPVYTDPGVHIEVEAGATLTAGDIVESTVTGTAIVRATGVPAGTVVQGAASGAKAIIRFAPAML